MRQMESRGVHLHEQENRNETETVQKDKHMATVGICRKEEI